MGIVRTKGIVIKIANSSENDKILTVLTAERGKIRVFCKGAKKMKSTFLASTEFLSFSDMVLFEGNGDSRLHARGYAVFWRPAVYRCVGSEPCRDLFDTGSAD